MDPILGMPFLQGTNPQIDWVSRSVCLNGRKLNVTTLRDDTIEIVSAKQFIKGYRANDYVWQGSLQRSTATLNFTHRAAHGSDDTVNGDISVNDDASKSILEKLQLEFPKVFEEPKFPIRRKNEELFEHRIRLIDEKAPPPKRKIYPLDANELEELKKQLTEWLESNRITPSNSPYGAPVLFAQKKNGKLRLCVDYRALNKQTIVDSYPLPRIDELLNRLQGAKFFSRLDLRDGYHQLPIAEQDKHKTAFTCRYGTFQFNVMAFGFSNAPSTFQRVMNTVFFDMLDNGVIIYLDDILIYSRTLEEHQQILRKVFSRLAENQLFVRPEKCALLLKSVDFLGHVIDTNGVHVQLAKIDAVRNWPEPQCITEVQQFLGLANYYRRFIRSYATVAQPLTDLLKMPKKSFDFGNVARKAFVQLKNCLTAAPVLRIFDPQLPTRVLADTSGVATGALLEQKFSNKWHPVEFYSKRLSSTEGNYSATERELLGCMLAMERWRPYLIGIRFQLLTDHKPLIYLQSQSKLSRRQARWLDVLAQFDVEFVHTPGTTHIAADALSRRPHAQRGLPEAEELRSPGEVQAIIGIGDGGKLRRHIREAQENSQDEEFQQILSKAQQNLQAFSVRNGIVMKLVDDEFVPVVPRDAKDLRDVILRELHDSALGGHVGRHKMQNLIRTRFYWPKMHEDIRIFCQECVICQRNKVGTQKQAGLLHPIPPASKPFDEVTMDLITNLPMTQQGNDAILTIVDRFSKLVHFIPCTTTISAVELAQLFFNRWICRFGMPRRIISDRDPRFLSRFWTQLMTRLNCKLGLSSSYHPQTDGQSERFNRSIEQILRCQVAPSQSNWDEVISSAEFALNSTVHAAHSHTPFRVIYGVDVPLPVDRLMANDDYAEVESVTQLLNRRNKIQQMVLDALQTNNQRMATQADKRRRDVSYNVGDFVYVSSTNVALPQGFSRKLAPKWLGPYRILSKINDVAFKIDLPARFSKMHNVFHVSLLKLHHGDLPDSEQPVVFSDAATDDVEFEVEQILDSRTRRRGRSVIQEYLVLWKGFPLHEASWEPESHCINAPEAIQQFLSRSLGTKNLRRGE